MSGISAVHQHIEGDCPHCRTAAWLQKVLDRRAALEKPCQEHGSHCTGCPDCERAIIGAPLWDAYEFAQVPPEDCSDRALHRAIAVARRDAARFAALAVETESADKIRHLLGRSTRAARVLARCEEMAANRRRDALRLSIPVVQTEPLPVPRQSPIEV